MAMRQAIDAVNHVHQGAATNRVDQQFDAAVDHAKAAYWAIPEHARFVNQAMMNMLYAMVTELLLTQGDGASNTKLARNVHHILAIKFRAAVEYACGLVDSRRNPKLPKNCTMPERIGDS